ncbi:MAG: beta-galactosidase, partial [Halieaceae bacterium]
GLYRGVELMVTQPLHIEMMDYASPGVYVTQRSVTTEQANIDVQSTIVNDGDSEQQALVYYELRDTDDRTVAQQAHSITVAAQGSTAVKGNLTISNPHLWQGVKDPYLYQMAVRLEQDGTLADSLQQPVGLRSFTVSPARGAFLNGQSARLRGVNRHQDREGKGWAVSKEDHRQDFEMIAEMGANAVRLAHYQHDEYVYQLADQMGFMVWAEVPVISEVTDSEAFTASAQQQLIELIRQNYNHPSIVVWGLFNEISIHGSEVNTRLVNKLEALAKQEDPNRLTTGAVLGNHEDEGVWLIPDIIAQNRYDGWYYNDFDGMATWLDKTHAAFPGRAIGISEYGAGSSVDLHSEQPVNQDHTEEYQNRYHEANWLIMRERPNMWGSFIWNMFDFAADLRDEGSTPGINNKGLVSFDRETKKDSYYWYQSHWRDVPLLYITSRRFDVRKTPSTAIKIYSNLNEVELLVNGESQGKRHNDGSNLFQWQAVALAMGDNRIAARSIAEEALADEVVWQRILNDDTGLSSKSLGIDSEQHRIYNLPYGLSRGELAEMLSLPYGAALAWPEDSSLADIVPDDLQFTVIAANEDRQVYSLGRGALSLGRPVKASRELTHGMMGNPPAAARNVVDGNDQLDGESGEDAFWITADPNQGPGWLKIDLGANYYIERLDAAWLPKNINEKGTVQYSIEIAEDVATSAVVFAETYREVVDQRDNKKPLRSSDQIGAVARYVRVHVLDSSYSYDVPILGTFKLIGATEFSVYGGVIFSESLVIDYPQRQISVKTSAAAGLTVDAIVAQLQAVAANTTLEIWSSGSRLNTHDTVKPGDYLLVSLPGDALQRKERYDFVMTET